MIISIYEISGEFDIYYYYNNLLFSNFSITVSSGDILDNITISANCDSIKFILAGEEFVFNVNLIDGFVSINEQLPSITDFKLYPNPVVDVLNLEFNAEESNDIQIYNITGQLVETINSNNGFNKISYNTAHLSKGFYIIKIGTFQSSFVR